MNLLATRIKTRSSLNFGHHASNGSAGHGRRAPRMVPRTEVYSYPLAKEYTEYLEMKKKAMVIDPEIIAGTPKVVSSTFAKPWNHRLPIERKAEA